MPRSHIWQSASALCFPGWTRNTNARLTRNQILTYYMPYERRSSSRSFCGHCASCAAAYPRSALRARATGERPRTLFRGEPPSRLAAPAYLAGCWVGDRKSAWARAPLSPHTATAGRGQRLARPLRALLAGSATETRRLSGYGGRQMTAGIITREIYYPHAPERVWAALTTSEAIAKWLMPNDFEPRLGHHFTFHTTPTPALKFDGICHCEVTAFEPPRLLAYTWNGGSLHTLVTYRLEPERDGTRLWFEHSGFNMDDPIQEASYRGMQGWNGVLDISLRREIEALTTQV